MRNPGKIFEDDFKKSIPSHCWYKRLNDNASSFAGGQATRFTTSNECDFIMFDDDTRTLYALELKSTKTSLTFWREDFANEKHKHFDIKKNQILGLKEWSKHNMVCGFIFNFREKANHTFFIMVDDFLDFIYTTNKKSIGFNDVLQINHIEIENIKVRTRYKYDMDKFCAESRL